MNAAQNDVPAVNALHVKCNPGHVQSMIQLNYRVQHDAETVKLMNHLQSLKPMKSNIAVNRQIQTVNYDDDDDINWLFYVNICDNICDDAVNELQTVVRTLQATYNDWKLLLKPPRQLYLYACLQCSIK